MHGDTPSAGGSKKASVNCVRGHIALVLLAIIGAACPTIADAHDAKKVVPVIRPGAVELGVTGAMTTIEGVTSGSLASDIGFYRRLGAGLVAGSVEIGYQHVSSLDVFDLQGIVSWQTQVGDGGNYPYVSVGGGLRHEELGSFGQSRYPVGFGVGFRSLIGVAAGLRFEYRFRRVLNDPVKDFSEHKAMIGVSLFFRNRK